MYVSHQYSKLNRHSINMTCQVLLDEFYCVIAIAFRPMVDAAGLIF